MSLGKLYIIAAPSGAGKSSLVNALTESMPNLMVSISYTTRPQRPGEVEGEHYHFVTKTEFEAMIKNNLLLEYAKVFAKVADYYYGTGRQWVEKQLAVGKNVILEIDWQGAQQIFAQFPEAIGIFILPPSLTVLEQRLKDRARDDLQTIQLRMSVAQDEISHYRDYQYLVVNDIFATALKELQAIFRGEIPPINWQDPQLSQEIQQLLQNLLA